MMRSIDNHGGKVYDVAWNLEARPHVFASVGNDRTIVVHDLRDGSDKVNFSNPEAGHTADMHRVLAQMQGPPAASSWLSGVDIQ